MKGSLGSAAHSVLMDLSRPMNIQPVTAAFLRWPALTKGSLASAPKMKGSPGSAVHSVLMDLGCPVHPQRDTAVFITCTPIQLRWAAASRPNQGEPVQVPLRGKGALVLLYIQY